MSTLLKIILAIGVSAIAGALIYIGRKLQILDGLVKTVDTIKCNLKVVSDFLVRYQSKFNPSELKSLSPFHLTEVGKELIKKLGFDNVFEKNKADFFGFISDENPKLKYDVEVAAIKSISALYEKDYMSFLKVYFYNNPKRNLEDTAPTLGVYVRDKYLSEHPEITQ